MADLVRKDIVDVNGVSTHRMVRPAAEATQATKDAVAGAAVPSATAAADGSFAGVYVDVEMSNYVGPNERAYLVSVETEEGRSAKFSHVGPPNPEGGITARDVLYGLAQRQQTYSKYSTQDEFLDAEGHDYENEERWDQMTRENGQILRLFGTSSPEAIDQAVRATEGENFDPEAWEGVLTR